MMRRALALASWLVVLSVLLAPSAWAGDVRGSSSTGVSARTWRGDLRPASRLRSRTARPAAPVRGAHLRSRFPHRFPWWHAEWDLYGDRESQDEAPTAPDEVLVDDLPIVVVLPASGEAVYLAEAEAEDAEPEIPEPCSPGENQVVLAADDDASAWLLRQAAALQRLKARSSGTGGSAAGGAARAR